VTAGSRKLLISAFGINMGGGLVLLEALLAGARDSLHAVLLDSRLKGRAPPLRADVAVEYVRPTMPDRLRALNRFTAMAAPGDVVLCFNGLPPLRKTRARVINFIQAPHFVGAHRGISYSWRPAVRMSLERAWLRWGVGNCDEVWVQTRTMAELFRAQHPSSTVAVVPLVDAELLQLFANPPSRAVDATPSFFYPADAVGHKNHANLLKAWSLLADSNDAPRLYLTLEPEEFAATLAQSGLGRDRLASVTSVGRLSRTQVLERLKSSSALIFPSRAETFGLPLLEAQAVGVPVIASDRDFVRDVCEPRQTFDPESPQSIALAVRRFMDQGAAAASSTAPPKLVSAAEFARRLLA
jgi:glycosyltransferase involved in cell wall biosynthesis